jgi:Recombinase
MGTQSIQLPPPASAGARPDDIRGAGHTSLRAIAEELNARGMLTRRGGRWHVSTVTDLLERLGLRKTSGAVHSALGA